jgi:D-aspartate ligase
MSGIKVNEYSERPSHADVPAVVLSGNLGAPAGVSINEAALALTRSLGRYGVRVFRFHPDRSLADLHSRYATHVPCPNLYDEPLKLVDALIAFSEKSGTRPVLYPASDGAAQFIADHRPALADHFVFTSPDAACIARTQHKRELIESARAIGIPVPQTWFPTDIGALPGIAAQISYPAIVKPLYSPDWKRAEVTSVFGRVKALKMTGPRQLVEQCAKLLSLNSEFMVQEIVPGPDENLITFIGYVGDDGKVRAGCVRKKLRQYPAGFGYCSLTESVDDREVLALAEELIGALGYRGIGCVEFKRDPRDGKPKLIEINTRAVRTSMLAIGAGVDFPWIAYRDRLAPGTVAPVIGGKVPMRWVHLRDEIWAASGLILHGELSLRAWIKGFFGKPLVTAEFSWDDVRPALVFWAQTPRSIARRLFNRNRRAAPATQPAAVQRAAK